jgi:hypothetical protein
VNGRDDTEERADGGGHDDDDRDENLQRMESVIEKFKVSCGDASQDGSPDADGQRDSRGAEPAHTDLQMVVKPVGNRLFSDCKSTQNTEQRKIIRRREATERQKHIRMRAVQLPTTQIPKERIPMLPNERKHQKLK